MHQTAEATRQAVPARAGRRGAAILAFDRLQSRDRAAAALIGLVASARGVPPILLLHRSRCAAEVALARQVAMYLMHVVLTRNMTDIGHYFRRDRTTVTHACAQMEDMRDDPAFDAEMTELEQAIAVMQEAVEHPHAAAR